MNCRTVRKWIWQEGVKTPLPPTLGRHLDECPQCRSLREEVALLDGVIGGSSPAEPDPSYWNTFPQKVARRLQEPSQPIVWVVPSRPAVGWRWVVQFAPLAGAAVLATLVGRELVRERPLPTVTERDVPVVREERVGEQASAPTGSTTSSSQASYPVLTPPAPSSRYAQPAASARPSGREAEPTTSVPAGVSETAARSPQLPSGSPEPQGPPSGSPTVRVGAARAQRGAADGRVWPERQVTIMGQIPRDTPHHAQEDTASIVGQGPFGAYERQMAHNGVTETTNAGMAPGRLMEAPHRLSPGGFADSQSPAEAMRRFEETADIRRQIGTLQATPLAERTMHEQAQLCALWYRLGMLTGEPMLLDSAIAVVGECLRSVGTDAPAAKDWTDRQMQLEKRRQSMAR